MLKLENVSRRYTTKKKIVDAVDDISLEFDKGEFVSILGLSGSGKTTLVSQIGGLDRPTSGKLLINDVDTSAYNSQDWADYRLNNIGFVFQDFNLINHLTAKENIEIALSLSGYTVQEKSDRADELLEMMGLEMRSDQLPSQLSGGEKQRVAIARALANHPDIILADEPTGALDPDTSVQIMDILQSLARKGHLVIMVTHNKYLARDYSTRIVELADGQVINEEILGDYHEHNEAEATFKRSSLELKTAIKIAYNNLKIRKKSTIFSLVSLIPSMVLIFALVNFVFNMVGYQEDFRPIIDGVLNRNESYYLTHLSDGQLDIDIKRMVKSISDRQYDFDEVTAFVESVMVPFSDETLEEISQIQGVEMVMKPMMFNIDIDNNDFIIVTLPPKAYKDYQYAVADNYYPEDDDQGLILSVEAVKRLKGKYNDDLLSIIGEEIDLKLWGINGFGLSRITNQEERHKLSLPVLNVMDKEAKTTLIENYYGGYIFVPYELGVSIFESFDSADMTLISTRPPNPLAGETEPVVLGPLFVMDLLKPLREKTMLQDSYNLFDFRQYTYMMPSNNFGIKHHIMTNETFDETSLEELQSYGVIYSSAYDDMTVASSETTQKYISYSIWIASIVAVAIILIPSLLVCVILYISILLRVKEIGILKSIGARNRDILYIFTLEAGMVAALGTIAGIGLSIPMIQMTQNILEDQYRISFYLGSNPMAYNIVGLVAAALMAFLLVTIFGLLPGRKASKLQPNVLLKHIN